MEHELNNEIHEYDQNQEFNELMQTSIDLLGEHYMNQVTRHIEANRFDDADAIYEEFVDDGRDPEDGTYEWIFMDRIV
jgi:cytochrome c553